MPQFLSRNVAVEVVLSIKELWAETRAFLEGKAVSGGLESTQSPPRLVRLGVAAGLGMVPVPHSWTRRRRRRHFTAP